MQFEWDPRKARSNFIKHGVTFNEGTTAFHDTLSVTVADPLHSETEDRFVLIGTSFQNRLLVIVHIDRGERIRIITARKATRQERNQYEKGQQR